MFDDFFDEPSEFEKQIFEFKESLKNVVKQEILDEMERLREENRSLREIKKLKQEYVDISRERPKCSKCNSKRKILFKSPSGADVFESCECSVKDITYVPYELTLCSFIVNYTGAIEKFYCRKEETNKDFYGDLHIVIAEGEKPNYDEINCTRTAFLSKEDCQKYCDWLTEKEKKERHFVPCVTIRC